MDKRNLNEKSNKFWYRKKKYEQITDRKSPTAYVEIKRFLEKNSFEHRQGSGYISKESLIDHDITALIINMTLTLDWFKYCIKQIDVTNIGKQHSLLETINSVSIKDVFDELEI